MRHEIEIDVVVPGGDFEAQVRSVLLAVLDRDFLECFDLEDRHAEAGAAPAETKVVLECATSHAPFPPIPAGQ